MNTTEDSTGALLRETAARIFQGVAEPAMLRAAEQGTWPRAGWTALEDAGLHRAMVPEAAGGFGVAMTDALSLLRVAAEHALPLPLAETMLASWLLAEAGMPIPDGPLTVAPMAAGDGVQLDGGRLSGTVGRVPWGRNAEAAVILVDTISPVRLALVRKEHWQVAFGENIAREPRDTLSFDHVPAATGDNRVDRPALRAMGAAMRTQQIAGALVRLTEMTTQYAQDRVQFGRPIGKFQAVQQNIAVLAGQTAAAGAAADLAAEAAASGLNPLPIAAAKARAGEAAGIGAAIAHQVHGAIGFTFEHSLHFLTRRLWSWRDEFGNEAEWNRLVGRHMARAGADRLWADITAA
jgi:acyl-CoA dehydrogenase